MIERLKRSADFERVLRTPIRARSAHFAAHHVGDKPSTSARPPKAGLAGKLSTADTRGLPRAVDESSAARPAVALTLSLPAALWLGAVVPKRHARRSVTRSLFKRQIRAAVERQQHAMACGLWVIRLRAPFDVAQFPSASSQALQSAARAELEQLLVSATQRGPAR